MCGLSGFIDTTSARGPAERERILAAMTAAIVHRGPNSQGLWLSGDAVVGLGHRRLSILDLSPAGHQPMTSPDGRFILVYNGEVFNFAELRRELEGKGFSFSGHSDTEVILAGFCAWGIDVTVRRLIGMFAIAVWDQQERRLSLIRDRLGVKPLYVGRFDGLTVFGSELKALRAHPGWPARLDRDALASYCRHAYVPAPASIYQGVRKLLPGHILTVDSATGRESLTCYWDLRETAIAGRAHQHEGSDQEIIEAFETLLSDSVSRRMVADVPLGAFLSGGIDSSTVVALMQRASDRPVRSFSIGFNEQGFDEAKHAKMVANHLGTDHSELYVTPDHALNVIPRLPEWFDEPFADSSQIPTYLLSEMTRGHVTVALSGDGGDEILAGYTRYHRARSLWRHLGLFPTPLRTLAADMIAACPHQLLDPLGHLLPASKRHINLYDKLLKSVEVLRAPDEDAIYRRLVSYWPNPEELVCRGKEIRTRLWDGNLRAAFPSFLDRMQYLDMATYLPDDILTKVDRTSMAVALEARVPLLDHRLVEFCWGLPERFKIRDGVTKWLLREVLYRHVPRELVERPKMGFGVPIEGWLRGPLRDWAAELLNPARLAAQGLFRPEVVERTWTEHLSGRRNWAYPLWTVLMAEAWIDRWQPDL